MNYNYAEGPPGAGSNRQAPSPSQNMNHVNGVNGAVGLPGIMAGLPTPAGHQSDLNYVYGMVEELSRTLAENRAASERINAAVGRVRQRALELNMTNDEIVTSVASDLHGKFDTKSPFFRCITDCCFFLDSGRNLESENSQLRRELDEAAFERDENYKLCREYATVMRDMLQRLHEFKIKTTTDMSAWHKSYRKQLAEEREENLNLRLRLADMQASASRGAEALRKFRRGWEEDPELTALHTENIALRQEKRAWKRMALRHLDPDDSEFSDDDDMIDPEEKKRLARVEIEKMEKRKAKALEDAETAASIAANSIPLSAARVE